MDLDVFQLSVQEWLLKTFHSDVAFNKQERNLRFIEESLELVQSLGMTKEKAHELVDYVYNRPIGKLEQEVGGVMVTLAALCYPNTIILSDCAAEEFNRINDPEIIEKIRAKQASKPQSIKSK